MAMETYPFYWSIMPHPSYRILENVTSVVWLLLASAVDRLSIKLTVVNDKFNCLGLKLGKTLKRRNCFSLRFGDEGSGTLKY